MSLPNQDLGTAGETYGHKFIWTAQHPDISELRKGLYTYDTLASEAIDRIDAISPPVPNNGQKCPMGQRDLYGLLLEHREKDETLNKLYHEITDIPDWVDWAQIERGQRVVKQYHGQAILGLLLNSLLGGMAAWRVVETLARTGGFGVNVTRRRLLETSQHFIECIESLDAVKPGGSGYVSSVRVRLLHATVRRRIIQLAKDKPGYYDIAKWGVPINDLHQIGTIDAYSTALVYLSLPRQGIVLSEQKIADYLALWRWIGHIMGTPVGWMETPERAKAMMETVMKSELDPSRNSQIIANNILTAQVNVPPLYASREYLAALAYRVNGDALAAALHIDRPSLYYRCLAGMQCLLLMSTSAIYGYLPETRQRRRDARFIAHGHEMVRSQRLGGIGHSSKFEFQYTPAIGKMTEMAAFGPSATLMVLMAVVLVSNLLYPWQEIAARRVGELVMPGEQVLQGLL
ncbi:uncharacterized protein F5Z01DRAFT_680338 [Emericellopsis atlantica]|uniref:ER-bound oxygenase mpaB/mpaB'/Rubber oxygenase catalytic domain-containing protein n=1 Tax=Emericellopsis atlantica TaxID=2614577 RepID=A0A9P7ZQD2_9HYPO|nr:uncharacterized protein F5Z01DRAFT_680338 [Emericellopsis atlantica]KAG9256399.1 hypothetical protein F5Z01DRAFT_680338 [Emericellopsis atlantica]